MLIHNIVAVSVGTHCCSLILALDAVISPVGLGRRLATCTSWHDAVQHLARAAAFVMASAFAATAATSESQAPSKMAYLFI